jgi:RNA-directed DNA polymerase
MSEIPVHPRPRRLADWINPAGARKVHSLVDKVYQRNLEMAWEKVKANRGSGGVDGQSLEAFAAQLDQQLDRLQSELKDDTYQPQPVRQVQIPKAGKPGEFRTLGIPTIYDRVCQQALLNRLEPIFEPVLDEANFGYRRGRSTKDAMRKVWKEIQSGRGWIVDADLRDFFGSVDHEKLLTLVAQRIADGRVLRLIRAMLKAGSYGKGRLFPSERGTPQGGVTTPRTQKVTSTLNGGCGTDRNRVRIDTCRIGFYRYDRCRAPATPRKPNVSIALASWCASSTNFRQPLCAWRESVRSPHGRRIAISNKPSD